MPLTLDVSIWGWEGIGGVDGWGRVGHVMVSDPSTNTALLSQFPHRFGQASVPKGPNILMPFSETYLEEEGVPDVIYEITISDASVAAFQTMASNHLNRPIWDWDPTPPTQTHCARAVYDSLKAGGLPIDPTNQYVIKDGQTNEILPNSLWKLMEDAGIQPSVQRSANFDSQTIKDNETVVSFARRENIWIR